MKTIIVATSVPPESALCASAGTAYFHDCHQMAIAHQGRSALELYLAVIAKTPRWVNRLMALRNAVVLRLGLKDLGHLGAIDAAKPASAYRVGDRVGIFSLLHLSDHEVILGDSDKHLRVQVSICKLVRGQGGAVAVSTVVHIHNLLGRVYMWFVAPVHRLIVPAVLRRL